MDRNQPITPDILAQWFIEMQGDVLFIGEHLLRENARLKAENAQLKAQRGDDPCEACKHFMDSCYTALCSECIWAGEEDYFEPRETS